MCHGASSVSPAEVARHATHNPAKARLALGGLLDADVSTSDRLQSIRNGVTRNYTYDKAGRISAAGAVSYTLNANGNLTDRTNDNFSYDAANRLTAVDVAGGTSNDATYSYDGDGNRTSRIDRC